MAYTTRPFICQLSNAFVTKGTENEGKEEPMATRSSRSGSAFRADDHPLPEETVRLGDSFRGSVLGEYELPLLELCRRISSGEDPEGVPGTAVRSGNAVVVTAPSGYLQDLDSLPFVSSVYSRHLPVERYNNPNALHPQVMIMGGRGCPNMCTFCVFPQTLTGRSYRSRSAGNAGIEIYFQGCFP